ncbi:MAG: hypothetical protein LBI10_02415 [Deltaproteobacteria bacterium]|jgi:hypothetical protein|nr:hypothetical protein [Deltaproteobacteria bacterium]
MKRSLAILALLSLAAFGPGCAATLTPTERLAFDQAVELNYGAPPNYWISQNHQKVAAIIPDERFLVSEVDGLKLNGPMLPGKNVCFVDPGERKIVMSEDTGVSAAVGLPIPLGAVTLGIGVGGGTIKTRLPLVKASFEAGKSYRAHLKDRTIVFDLIADPAELAKVEGYRAELALVMVEAKKASDLKDQKWRDFLAYSKSHPNRLEGRWSFASGLWELEFSGNRVVFLGPKLISSRHRLEGEFIFSENALVFKWDYWDAIFVVTDRRKEGSYIQTEVWYYTLNGDTLEIKRGGQRPMEMGGTYQKVR